MWLRLVEQHNRLAKARTPPTDLVCLLRVLIEKRSSDEFSGGTTALLERNLGQDLVKTDDTEVLDLLCNVADFQKKCSEGEYDKRQGKRKCFFEPQNTNISNNQRYIMDSP